MYDYKIVLGYLATFISVASYVPYFRNIFLGKVKPHAFSWLVWSLLTAVAFGAQISERGGAGAWVTASTALACFAVFILALFKGRRDFTSFDWYALAAALVAFVLWWLTKDPTLSVILVTVTDALGFLPTFRKGYYKPNEDSIALYGASIIKYTLGILALNSFSLSTWLFPASLILTNGLFVMLLFIRRKQSPSSQLS
jgi:branched-subunit amino acid transport protein